MLQLITKAFTPNNLPTKEAHIAEKPIWKQPTKPEALPDFSACIEMAEGMPKDKINALAADIIHIGTINCSGEFIWKKFKHIPITL